MGGPFRLIEPVGAGGPGGVWRAADTATRHEVAVKALAAHAAGDTVAQARFRLVARTVLQLSDPGIAHVREFGEAELADGRIVPYLVRDLIPGRTLGERLRAAALPPGEALRVVAATADALAAAHRAGIAHGHLVPANIILAPGGVRVTDFGLWALRPRPDEDRAPGALSYAAPELAEGGPATPAADMYALGVVFLACLAGIGPGGLTPGQVSPPDSPADPAGRDSRRRAHRGPGAGHGAAGLAALWAACLGPNPAERPGAAHAAVMSRQALTGGLAAPSWSAAQDQPAPAPGQRRAPPTGLPAPKARAADWTEERGERGDEGPERRGNRRGKARRRRKKTEAPDHGGRRGHGGHRRRPPWWACCWPLHPGRTRPARPRPPPPRGPATRSWPGPARRHRPAADPGGDVTGAGHQHPDGQAAPAVPAGRDQPAVPDHRRGGGVRAGPPRRRGGHGQPHRAGQDGAGRGPAGAGRPGWPPRCGRSSGPG